MKTVGSGRLLLLLSLLFLSIPLLAKAVEESEEWHIPPQKAEVPNPLVSDQTTIALGKKGYEAECRSCHGKSGKGDGPKAQELEKKIADLNSEKILGQTDGALFWKISVGRKPMPAYKKLFTEEERWAVVIYIRQLCHSK